MKSGKIVLCELKWLWFQAIFYTKNCFGFCLSQDYSARACSILRSLLRCTPWWTKGHLRLGLIELEALKFSKEPDSLRIATVRCSALAAMKLIATSDEKRELPQIGKASREAEIAENLLRELEKLKLVL